MARKRFTDDDVERVASALYHRVWTASSTRWEGAGDDVKEHYRDMARIALTAFLGDKA